MFMRGRAPSREPARPLKLPQPGPLRKYGAYVRLEYGDNMEVLANILWKV